MRAAGLHLSSEGATQMPSNRSPKKQNPAAPPRSNGNGVTVTGRTISQHKFPHSVAIAHLSTVHVNDMEEFDKDQSISDQNQYVSNHKRGGSDQDQHTPNRNLYTIEDRYGSDAHQSGSGENDMEEDAYTVLTSPAHTDKLSTRLFKREQTSKRETEMSKWKLESEEFSAVLRADVGIVPSAQTFQKPKPVSPGHATPTTPGRACLKSQSSAQAPQGSQQQRRVPLPKHEMHRVNSIRTQNEESTRVSVSPTGAPAAGAPLVRSSSRRSSSRLNATRTLDDATQGSAKDAAVHQRCFQGHLTVGTLSEGDTDYDALSSGPPSLMPSAKPSPKIPPKDLGTRKGSTRSPSSSALPQTAYNKSPEGLQQKERCLGTDPEGASTDPKGVSTDPKGVSTDPKGVSTDPKGVSTDPKGVSTDPKGVSTDPKGVSTDPSALPAMASALTPQISPRLSQWKAVTPRLPPQSTSFAPQVLSHTEASRRSRGFSSSDETENIDRASSSHSVETSRPPMIKFGSPTATASPIRALVGVSPKLQRGNPLLAVGEIFLAELDDDATTSSPQKHQSLCPLWAFPSPPLQGGFPPSISRQSVIVSNPPDEGGMSTPERAESPQSHPLREDISKFGIGTAQRSFPKSPMPTSVGEPEAKSPSGSVGKYGEDFRVTPVLGPTRSVSTPESGTRSGSPKAGRNPLTLGGSLLTGGTSPVVGGNPLAKETSVQNRLEQWGGGRTRLQRGRGGITEGSSTGGDEAVNKDSLSGAGTIQPLKIGKISTDMNANVRGGGIYTPPLDIVKSPPKPYKSPTPDAKSPIIVGLGTGGSRASQGKELLGIVKTPPIAAVNMVNQSVGLEVEKDIVSSEAEEPVTSSSDEKTNRSSPKQLLTNRSHCKEHNDEDQNLTKGSAVRYNAKSTVHVKTTSWRPNNEESPEKDTNNEEETKGPEADPSAGDKAYTDSSSDTPPTKRVMSDDEDGEKEKSLRHAVQNVLKRVERQSRVSAQNSFRMSTGAQQEDAVTMYNRKNSQRACQEPPPRKSQIPTAEDPIMEMKGNAPAAVVIQWSPPSAPCAPANTSTCAAPLTGTTGATTAAPATGSSWAATQPSKAQTPFSGHTVLSRQTVPSPASGQTVSSLLSGQTVQSPLSGQTVQSKDSLGNTEDTVQTNRPKGRSGFLQFLRKMFCLDQGHVNEAVEEGRWDGKLVSKGTDGRRIVRVAVRLKRDLVNAAAVKDDWDNTGRSGLREDLVRSLGDAWCVIRNDQVDVENEDEHTAIIRFQDTSDAGPCRQSAIHIARNLMRHAEKGVPLTTSCSGKVVYTILATTFV